MNPITCAYCGARRPAGAMLRVVPVDPRRAPFAVCRHVVAAACIQAAGSRAVTRIEHFDAAAARSFDMHGSVQPAVATPRASIEAVHG